MEFCRVALFPFLLEEVSLLVDRVVFGPRYRGRVASVLCRTLVRLQGLRSGASTVGNLVERARDVC